MLDKKNRVTILVILIILLLSLSVSNAQNISVATGEWIPFTSASMENYGEFTKRVTIVFNEMGIEPDYFFYPWRRCFDAVIKGRVWAAFPYSYTEDRAAKVWFSDMLSCSRTVFFYYRRENSLRKYNFNNMADLKAYKIGGVTGYFYEETFKDANLEVDYVNKEIYAMEKLKMGRIDLLPVNELVGWNLIRTHFPDDAYNFKTLNRPLNEKPLRLIVSKDYPESKKLFDRFNQALQRCIEKGLIKIEKCK
jgi:polar amino acid transport system substrate-binding protein